MNDDESEGRAVARQDDVSRDSEALQANEIQELRQQLEVSKALLASTEQEHLLKLVEQDEKVNKMAAQLLQQQLVLASFESRIEAGGSSRVSDSEPCKAKDRKKKGR